MTHIFRFPRSQSYALARNVATCPTVTVTALFPRASTDDAVNVIVAALALHRSFAPRARPCLQPPFPASSGPSDLLYTLAQHPHRRQQPVHVEYACCRPRTVRHCCTSGRPHALLALSGAARCRGVVASCSFVSARTPVPTAYQNPRLVLFYASGSSYTLDVCSFWRDRGSGLSIEPPSAGSEVPDEVSQWFLSKLLVSTGEISARATSDVRAVADFEKRCAFMAHVAAASSERVSQPSVDRFQTTGFLVKRRHQPLRCGRDCADEEDAKSQPRRREWSAKIHFVCADFLWRFWCVLLSALVGCPLTSSQFPSVFLDAQTSESLRSRVRSHGARASYELTVGRLVSMLGALADPVVAISHEVTSYYLLGVIVCSGPWHEFHAPQALDYSAVAHWPT